ncbi:MAG: hypothetical protein EXR21_10180 [Flavobacteriaceae bacterium]|nr:hypothetical protein [Flavobacteriaceae bacterium]
MTIVIFIVLLIVVLFLSDSKRRIDKNAATGALKNKHPNFVSFCESTDNISFKPMELVLFTGRKLEYRFPFEILGKTLGYYHIGIESIFTTVIYVYAISRNGYKHKGYMLELKKLGQEEPHEFDYHEILQNFLFQICDSKEFDKLDFEP